MKTLITILAISLCLFSCEKHEESKTENKVGYKITCETCTIEIGTAPKVRKFDVKEFFIFHTIETTPETNILVSGDGKMKTQVRLNGEVIFEKTDSDGQYMYNVKLK